MIKNRLSEKPSIINLIDFYLPVRGNLRRKSSLAQSEAVNHSSNTSAEQKEETTARIEKEITEIDRHYDFDVPSAIDWDLLIVSRSHVSHFVLERSLAAQGEQALQQAAL
jgi:hypothetical protein